MDEKLSEFRDWLGELVRVRLSESRGDDPVDMGRYFEAEFIMEKFDERFGA